MNTRRTGPWDKPSVNRGLYLIRLSPAHYYGGRSADLAYRWRCHYADLLAGKHYNRRMQAVFNLHGRFEPEILVAGGEGVDLKAEEQKWLDEHFRKPGCVNLVKSSDGGCPAWTEAQREKMMGHLKSPERVAQARESMKRNGRPPTPEMRARTAERNRSRAGIPQKPEHVAQRAEAHRGRKNTPETLALMSESAKRRAKEKPQVTTQATKDLISTQQKGRVWITDGKANLRMFPEAATPYLSSGWKPGRSGVVTRPDSARRRALEGA